LPEGPSSGAAVGRATGARNPRDGANRTSAGAIARPGAAAAEDPGSHSVLEGSGGAEPSEAAGAAAAAKSSPAAPPSDTAVPPAADRLFGAPLPRAAIYGGAAAFEPEAYRRCVTRLSLTELHGFFHITTLTLTLFSTLLLYLLLRPSLTHFADDHSDTAAQSP